MSNRAKYVEDAMNSDVSIAIKYVHKFEEMMQNHLEKSFAIAVTGAYEASMILKQLNVDATIYSIASDERFKILENGALILTDDETIAQKIKDQLKENTDLIYSPVLAAIGISILEDNVAVSK
jgi:dTDP-4-amino-4,6-dideoxygalactose transaminase